MGRFDSPPASTLTAHSLGGIQPFGIGTAVRMYQKVLRQGRPTSPWIVSAPHPREGPVWLFQERIGGRLHFQITERGLRALDKPSALEELLLPVLKSGTIPKRS